MDMLPPPAAPWGHNHSGGSSHHYYNNNDWYGGRNYNNHNVSLQFFCFLINRILIVMVSDADLTRDSKLIFFYFYFNFILFLKIDFFNNC